MKVKKKCIAIIACSFVLLILGVSFIAMPHLRIFSQDTNKPSNPETTYKEVSPQDFYEDVGGFSYRDTAEDYIYEVLIIEKDRIIIAPAFSDYTCYLRIEKIYKYSNETYKLDVSLVDTSGKPTGEEDITNSDISEVLTHHDIYISRYDNSIVIGDEVDGTEFIYHSKDEDAFYDYLWKFAFEKEKK